MTPKLFQPINVGSFLLKQRVVMAPMTRLRASKTHIPIVGIVKEYYEQRAHTPGTLLITEATLIAEKAGGYEHISNAVHTKGTYIFCQLYALGRAADPKVLAFEGLPYVSASDIQISTETVAPRPLTVEEIREYVQLYAQAAQNAISAGFDGVKIHGAHDFLPDQFTRDASNNRTDTYGGSFENRTRFPLEVVDAVAEAVGPERVGYRISPWSSLFGDCVSTSLLSTHSQETLDMKMANPIPTFTYLVSQLKARQPKLAYLHVVEPRVIGMDDRNEEDIGAHEGNDFIRGLWAPKALISTGGYNRQSAIDTAESKGGLIAFGRQFLANPDVVYRLEKNVVLNTYNRGTFYSPGDAPIGYTDYPFAEEFTAQYLSQLFI
ncbi:related to NADH:flavin oxidoreductase/12-oxophytodienoate reductase [Armillaria ostoyae]|uniref:Related to NADH:flavin oxidoreductase/12-oxophytodienoate reductase n=1 Tax=Armillaria ostoyae TaxID=47428 RepID=A0A284QRC5_ARMOS|nr:related to NADH:flavin oxidoreductase/12-oxophytodienoate reductase [Armillaria ostoyae]